MLQKDGRGQEHGSPSAGSLALRGEAEVTRLV